MKLIELTENHYIVVDNSEIKVGEYCYDSESKECYKSKGELPANPYILRITHSTKLSECCDSVELLYMNEAKALVGKVDIEQLAEQYAKAHSIYESGQDDVAYGFREGYNQCLEDNKDKKYTEDTLRDALFDALNRVQKECCMTHTKDSIVRDIIKALQPNKEWEVEFENGKLKLV